MFFMRVPCLPKLKAFSFLSFSYWTLTCKRYFGHTHNFVFLLGPRSWCPLSLCWHRGFGLWPARWAQIVGAAGQGWRWGLIDKINRIHTWISQKMIHNIKSKTPLLFAKTLDKYLIHCDFGLHPETEKESWSISAIEKMFSGEEGGEDLQEQSRWQNF